MNPICTNCRGENAYIVKEENPYEDKRPTIDEVVGTKTITLEYKTTTWKCRDCGYQVSG